MIRRTLVVLSFTALAACAAPAPAPEAEAPVKTIATGFRAGQDGLAYAMIFDLRAPFDTEVRAVTEFQNPVRGEPPLRVEQTLAAGQRRIAVNSPLMHEIGNHRDYTVVLTVYRDGALLVTHRDTARFDVEGAMVPMFIRRGITVR